MKKLRPLSPFPRRTLPNNQQWWIFHPGPHRDPKKPNLFNVIYFYPEEDDPASGAMTVQLKKLKPDSQEFVGKTLWHLPGFLTVKLQELGQALEMKKEKEAHMIFRLLVAGLSIASPGMRQQVRKSLQEQGQFGQARPELLGLFNLAVNSQEVKAVKHRWATPSTAHGIGPVRQETIANLLACELFRSGAPREFPLQHKH